MRVGDTARTSGASPIPPRASTTERRRARRRRPTGAARGSSGAVMSTNSLSRNGTPRGRRPPGRAPRLRRRPREPRAPEHLLAVADVDADLERGPALAERAHERRQQVLPGGGDGRDPQVSPGPARHLRRRLGALPEEGQDVGRVPRVGDAGRRRGDAATRALGELHPNLALSAATAAETDGWVTTSSSAAAVTEPSRTTARNADSWVTVTATARKKI